MKRLSNVIDFLLQPLFIESTSYFSRDFGAVVFCSNRFDLRSDCRCFLEEMGVLERSMEFSLFEASIEVDEKEEESSSSVLAVGFLVTFAWSSSYPNEVSTAFSVMDMLDRTSCIMTLFLDS